MKTVIQKKPVNIGQIPIRYDRETKHFFIVGQSGSGKSVFINDVLEQVAIRGDRMLVADPVKGDYTRLLKQQDGSDPVILAPWDRRSPVWDIAKDAPTLAEAAELAFQWIADSGGDPMWAMGAREILTGLIHKLQVDMGDEWVWGNLAQVLKTPSDAVEDVMQEYYPEALRAVEQIGDTSGKGVSKTTQSLMITMQSQLGFVFRLAEAWKDAKTKWSVSSFLEWNQGQITIMQAHKKYSQISKAYMRGILGMFQQYVNSPTYSECKPHDLERSIWVALDELPQLGDISEFVVPMVEAARSKGVRLALAMQDILQVEKEYGRESGKIVRNIVQNHVFCGMIDDTAEWASRLIGDVTLERHQRSVNAQEGGSVSYSASWQRVTERCVPKEKLSRDVGLDKTNQDGVYFIYHTSGGDAYRQKIYFSEKHGLFEDGCRQSIILADWAKPKGKKKDESKKEKVAQIEKKRAEKAMKKPQSKPVKKPTQKTKKRQTLSGFYKRTSAKKQQIILKYKG